MNSTDNYCFKMQIKYGQLLEEKLDSLKRRTTINKDTAPEHLYEINEYVNMYYFYNKKVVESEENKEKIKSFHDAIELEDSDDEEEDDKKE